MIVTCDLGINWTHRKLSPVLHFLAAATMKGLLALTFLAALSLAVISFRLIRFSFMYNACITKESSNSFQSMFQNQHFSSYYPTPPLPPIIIPIKPYITQNSQCIYTSIQMSLSVSKFSWKNCGLFVPISIWRRNVSWHWRIGQSLVLFLIFFSLSQQIITVSVF